MMTAIPRRRVACCATLILPLVLVWMSASPQAQWRGGGPTTQIRGGSPSRSANGRFLDLGLVVLDTRTNLMWEKKTVAGDDANIRDLHDAHHKYTWCVVTGNRTGRFCRANTTSWIGQVNAEAFAGFSNWRVPTRDELLTIVDCHGGAACVDPIFGPTQVEVHWSATEIDPAFAWYVNFISGGMAASEWKMAEFAVRAVRAAGP
jgi:hypothetical protein